MNHDSAWKEVLEKLFDKFLAFFFPDIYKDIDFSKGYEFRDKELQKITKNSETGIRIVDKLVKVYLRDGSEKWLLIHIEIQGYEQSGFETRMYVYNYRIFDKERREVISLAILTDPNPEYRPNEYRRSRWGFEVVCRFPIVKLIDYRDRLEELEASTQPFAIIVSAYLRTLEAGEDIQQRFTFKKRFLTELYRRGMQRETLMAVYQFIDWTMELPEELETEIYEETKIREEKKMSVLTTAERIGMKMGMEKGMEKGMKKGISAVHDAIAALIEAKFGNTGKLLIERMNHIQNLEALQELTQGIKSARTLTDAEKALSIVEARMTTNGKNWIP